MSIKLSIITINYNDKVGLEKTIKSVINQSWKEFEFIVIDGGSTDGSKELIEKYRNHISYSVSEQDTGVYNAMNKGIRVAKGDFLLFLNGGDCLFNAAVLKKIISKLETSTSIFYGNAVFVKDKIETLVEYPKKLNFSFFFNNSLCHQATFFNKDLFIENNYNEKYKIVSDWEFNVKNICLNNKRYFHLNETICYYDLNGISSIREDLSEQERSLVYTTYFSAFIDDYNKMKIPQDKRIKNMIYIKQYKIPWIILKGFSKIILFFLPKQKKTFKTCEF